MKYIFKKYIVITISIIVLIQFITSIQITGEWKNFLYTTFIFTILYFIGRPIANLIMLPINLLTLNLFSWIINILVFYVWTIIAKNVIINSWQFTGLNLGPIVLTSFKFADWQVIILSSILLTIIIQFMEWIIK